MATPPEQTAASGTQTFKGRAYDLLKSAGELRDGFLVVGATLYFLGYVTWALNSWQRGLGLLPALESQYFIAGIVPAAVILASYALVKLGVSGVSKLQEWLRRHISKHRRLGCLLFIISPTFFCLSLLSAIKGWSPPVTVAFFILFLLSAIVAPDMNDSSASRRTTRIMESALLILIVGASGLVALAFYLAVIYPTLPQALGGVKPRAVCLDVSTQDLSEETLAALIRKPAAEATPEPPAVEKPAQKAAGDGKPVAHSDEVELMFPGSDFILIGVGDKVYEIKKDAVHAVKPCE